MTIRRILAIACVFSLFAGVGAVPLSAQASTNKNECIGNCYRQAIERSVSCITSVPVCGVICVPTSGGNLPLCALACSGGGLLCTTIQTVRTVLFSCFRC